MFRMTPLLLAFLGCLTQPAASQDVAFGPVPDWVADLEVPDPPATHDQGGVDFLLVDTQVQLAAGPEQLFRRVVTAVRNDQGLSSESQIEVVFDPEYQQLELHSVLVRRAGQVLDRLVPDALRVLQREQQLEAQILDGRRSAVLLLEDVRVGDVVDYSYTLRGESPVFGRRWFSSYPLGYPVAVRRLHVRLCVPPQREILIQSPAGAPEPTREVNAQGSQIVWDLRDLGAVPLEQETPRWYPAQPWAHASEYRDWGEVARWGAQLFQCDAPAGEALQAWARELAGQSDDPLERTRLALRRVQREVRYLGLELGEGAHRPSQPESVLARRFGDCKDKTLLLIALLAELDIEARPALVSTSLLHTLADKLPAPGHFDHAIVCVSIGNGRVWVDPTLDSERGPINEFALLDYGLALVLDPQTRELTPVERKRGSFARTRIIRDFEVQLEQPTRLSIVSTFQGSDANTVRASYASTPRERYAAYCRDYVSQEYPQLAVLSPLRLEDDEELNRLVIFEEYSIPELWLATPQGGREEWARLVSQELGDVLQVPGTQLRSSPLHVQHPRQVSMRLSARLPGPWNVDPEQVSVRNPAFRFEQRIELTGSRLSIDSDFHSLSDHVRPENLAAYRADIDQARSNLVYLISDPRQSEAGEIPDAVAIWIGFAVLGAFTLVPLGAAGLVIYFSLRSRRRARASPANATGNDGPA